MTEQPPDQLVYTFALWNNSGDVNNLITIRNDGMSIESELIDKQN